MGVRTTNGWSEYPEQNKFTSMNANSYFSAFPHKNQYWGPKVCIEQSLQLAGHKLWVHTTPVGQLILNNHPPSVPSNIFCQVEMSSTSENCQQIYLRPKKKNLTISNVKFLEISSVSGSGR